MAQTNFDVFKGKDCGFVADWLKTKGLHKLCSVFEVIKNHFILSMNIKNLYKKQWNLGIFLQWGHLITRNGPTMAHLNSFLAQEGGICTKIFKNSNAR